MNGRVWRGERVERRRRRNFSCLVAAAGRHVTPVRDGRRRRARVGREQIDATVGYCRRRHFCFFISVLGKYRFVFCFSPPCPPPPTPPLLFGRSMPDTLINGLPSTKLPLQSLTAMNYSREGNQCRTIYGRHFLSQSNYGCINI